jgi:HEAT repeat protein
MTSKEEGGSAKLEGPRSIAVLFRAEHIHIMKIRVVSMDCSLDAGGLPFVWLSGVKPADSVELLESFVKGSDLEAHDDDHISHGALTAIALHADSAADRALESFTRTDQPESLRKQTTFWLGAAREKAGLLVLEKMAKTDPSSEVRAQVTFALSVSHEPGAIEDMIRMAHDDQSSHVRGQALFWLAQKAGQKAVGAITGAIENDPDTDVKKKAVFALSQLPKDEGVPKLIEVAQTNRNREVRKQAMFWLGQSHDPRALAFFEKILSQ